MPAPAQVSLPSDAEVCVTRQFNAPRQLVYDAHTRPDLVRRWQVGYPGWDMTTCEMEARLGGAYKWRWKNREDGTQFGFSGVFTEVAAPSRVVHEQYFDPGETDFAMPVGDPCIVSLDLSEANGVTTLVCTLKFVSKEARDAAVATGMSDGMEYNYKHLDALVAQAA